MISGRYTLSWTPHSTIITNKHTRGIIKCIPISLSKDNETNTNTKHTSVCAIDQVHFVVVINLSTYLSTYIHNRSSLRTRSAPEHVAQKSSQTYLGRGGGRVLIAPLQNLTLTKNSTVVGKNRCDVDFNCFLHHCIIYSRMCYYCEQNQYL